MLLPYTQLSSPVMKFDKKIKNLCNRSLKLGADFRSLVTLVQRYKLVENLFFNSLDVSFVRQNALDCLSSFLMDDFMKPGKFFLDDLPEC